MIINPSFQREYCIQLFQKEPKQFVKKNFRRKKLTKENLDKDMDKYWKGKKEVGNFFLNLRSSSTKRTR